MIDKFVEAHPDAWMISGWICNSISFGLFALFIYAITRRSRRRKPKADPPPEPEGE